MVAYGEVAAVRVGRRVGLVEVGAVRLGQEARLGALVRLDFSGVRSGAVVWAV
ncbi:hypothetical protein [Nonomuraea aridisoli]|uniref:hypothetical protein n=1 Tax=Nonomuraea aridisoli TaxID=2070368 RepID=UPI0015E8DE16|nr:hypothetical protein [Nonomuraea aridisoli]